MHVNFNEIEDGSEIFTVFCLWNRLSYSSSSETELLFLQSLQNITSPYSYMGNIHVSGPSNLSSTPHDQTLQTMQFFIKGIALLPA